MAEGLSVLARLMRQGRFEEFETGDSGTRTNTRNPALRGRTRGTTGARGVASPGNPATRNPDAQIDRERDMLNSPIMKAFLGRQAGV